VNRRAPAYDRLEDLRVRRIISIMHERLAAVLTTPQLRRFVGSIDAHPCRSWALNQRHLVRYAGLGSYLVTPLRLQGADKHRSHLGEAAVRRPQTVHFDATKTPLNYIMDPHTEQGSKLPEKLVDQHLLAAARMV